MECSPFSFYSWYIKVYSKIQVKCLMGFTNLRTEIMAVRQRTLFPNYDYKISYISAYISNMESTHVFFIPIVHACFITLRWGEVIAHPRLTTTAV